MPATSGKVLVAVFVGATLLTAGGLLAGFRMARPSAPATSPTGPKAAAASAAPTVGAADAGAVERPSSP